MDEWLAFMDANIHEWCTTYAWHERACIGLAQCTAFIGINSLAQHTALIRHHMSGL